MDVGLNRAYGHPDIDAYKQMERKEKTKTSCVYKPYKYEPEMCEDTWDTHAPSPLRCQWKPVSHNICRPPCGDIYFAIHVVLLRLL